MKQMKNKGQGAMEYLMTYGWAILVVMIVGVVLWQLGVFNTSESVVSTGWAKLRPISASIAYKADETFEATYQNTVGTSIRLTSIVVAETLTAAPNDDCIVDAVNAVPWQEGVTEVSVKAGDGFELTAHCADATKAEGDPFDLLITIQYTAVMGGVNTDHTETGHIRGPAEA